MAPTGGSPGAAPRGGQRAREPGVLSIKPFRRLWIALSLSSLGDWLSILALLALAAYLTQKHGAGQSATAAAAAQTTAVGVVWVATLLPALLLGPVAGAMADRLDRRRDDDRRRCPARRCCSCRSRCSPT